MSVDLEDGRRARGYLESDVKRVTDRFAEGVLTVEDGKLLTPHRIAKAIKELDSLEAAPSAGAVTATLKRWKEIGFADVNDAPLAFTGYTALGLSEGLTALKEKSRAGKSKGAAVASTTEPELPEPTETPDAPVIPLGDPTEEPEGAGEYPVPS